MDYREFIKQSLSVEGLPFYDTDIQHVQRIDHTVHKAKTALKAFPNLNRQIPITIVDQKVIL